MWPSGNTTFLSGLSHKRMSSPTLNGLVFIEQVGRVKSVRLLRKSPSPVLGFPGCVYSVVLVSISYVHTVCKSFPPSFTFSNSPMSLKFMKSFLNYCLYTHPPESFQYLGLTTWLSLSQQPLVACSSSFRGEALFPPSTSACHLVTVTKRVLFGWSSCWNFMGVASCHILYQMSWALTALLPPFQQCSLCLRFGGCFLDVSFRAGTQQSIVIWNSNYNSDHLHLLQKDARSLESLRATVTCLWMQG